MKNRHESYSSKSLTPAMVLCMTCIARDSMNSTRTAGTMMQSKRIDKMSANAMNGRKNISAGRRSFCL